MKNNKHIGMWACPRSRSTVTTRAFEQLDGCVVYDEPFSGAYLWHRSERFHLDKLTEDKRKEVESDHTKVIAKLTGELPEGALFSFQKLSTDLYLPEFGQEWILELNNFFLIRHPRDILLSFHRGLPHSEFDKQKEIDTEMIGIKLLYDIFKFLESTTGQTPLVISSDDVVKNPRNTLEWLCEYLGIEFHEKMLRWEAGLSSSSIDWIGSLDPSSDPWHATLRNSQSFLPYKENTEPFPEELLPQLEESTPYYEELWRHRHVFSD